LYDATFKEFKNIIPKDNVWAKVSQEVGVNKTNKNRMIKLILRSLWKNVPNPEMMLSFTFSNSVQCKIQ